MVRLNVYNQTNIHLDTGWLLEFQKMGVVLWEGGMEKIKCGCTIGGGFKFI